MMKTWLVRSSLVIALLLGLAQLVPVARTNPPSEEEISVPEPVRTILKRACYDCHGNAVNWPWYSRVAPASWWIAYDVSEGREAVNFSTWNRYQPEERSELIWETWEEVEEGEMPPWFYLILHPEARLTEDDRAQLRTWATATSGGDHDEKSEHD
jgi:hypothetical protein